MNEPALLWLWGILWMTVGFAAGNFLYRQERRRAKREQARRDRWALQPVTVKVGEHTIPLDRNKTVESVLNSLNHEDDEPRLPRNGSWSGLNKEWWDSLPRETADHLLSTKDEVPGNVYVKPSHVCYHPGCLVLVDDDYRYCYRHVYLAEGRALDCEGPGSAGGHCPETTEGNDRLCHRHRRRNAPKCHVWDCKNSAMTGDPSVRTLPVCYYHVLDKPCHELSCTRPTSMANPWCVTHRHKQCGMRGCTNATDPLAPLCPDHDNPL